MRKRWFIFLISLMIIFFLLKTSALKFQDLTKENFDNGTYFNTTHNNTAVILFAKNLTGSFTSKIFDAGSIALWNNLTWIKTNPAIESVFTVDAQSDVWSSSNQGVNWSLVKDDFNGGIGNGATDISINSSGALFILHNQDLWKSDNYGVNWTLINDDFNGASDSNNGIRFYIGDNNYIYVIDGSEDVYRSTNSGVNFSLLISDFNGGNNGNVFGLGSLIKSANITLQVKNCSSVNCGDANFTGADGSSNSYYTNLTNILGIQSRYFQYKVYFTTKDSSIKSELYNVSIDYTSLDNNAPNLTIISPMNINYTNSTIMINISATDDYQIDRIWFYNGSANITYTNTTQHTFPQGTTTLITYANDTNGNLNSTSITFRVDSEAPIISIIEPQQKTYGKNTSLELNFSVTDITSNISSCWYNLNNSNNITITNCQNTTFNVSNDGSHILKFFANDSLGNLVTQSINFSVITGAPAINLIYPVNNSYINYKENINLNYTAVSGASINYCQLWINSEGNWSLNKTNNSITSENNYFNLNLSDGSYMWRISCEDNFNKTSNATYNLNIDTIKPNLTLTEPKGAKSSRTNIPLTFSVNDSSQMNCWYNLYRGSTIEISNTSISCSSQNTFDVTIDSSSFELNLYANDSAGNINQINTSFSVDTTTSAGGSSGAGSTGGGGGGSSGGSIGSNVIINKDKIDLEIKDIGDLILLPGEIKTLQLSVKNIGNVFLNKCKIITKNGFENWLKTDQQKNIQEGEITEFLFSLSVPINVNEEDKPKIILSCIEKEFDINSKIIILKSDVDIKIGEMNLDEDKKITVRYSIKSDVSQEKQFLFIVSDQDGNKISETEKTISLKENEKIEEVINLEISGAKSGLLRVTIAEKDGKAFVEEFFTYNSGSITGFVAFDNVLNKAGSPTAISVIIFSLLALYLLFRIISHVIRHHSFKRKIRVKSGKIIKVS